MPGARRAASLSISSPGRSFSVSSKPAMGGVPALWAASEPTTRSERSPGVTTMQPGVSAFSRFGSIAPPNTKSSASRARPASSPSSTVPSSAAVICATVGAERAGSSGSTEQGTGSVAESRSAITSRSAEATRFTIIVSTSQPRPAYARYALRVSARTDSASWSWPPTTAITEAPNSLARRAFRASSSGSWVAAKSVPRTRTTS